MQIFRTLWRYQLRGMPARVPQDIKKVPFKPILPLKLRDRGKLNWIMRLHNNSLKPPLVSGKVDSQKQVACLHEMSVLFASMKDNEFNEKA